MKSIKDVDKQFSFLRDIIDKPEFDVELVRYMGELYRSHRLLLLEKAHGYDNCDEQEEANAHWLIHRMNYSINNLNVQSRYIIRREIVDGKTGNWYQREMSVTGYYRLRKKAYRDFLINLTMF